jgi:hypothetical protein
MSREDYSPSSDMDLREVSMGVVVGGEIFF